MNRISVITLVTMAIISSLAAATSVLRDSDDDVIHDHLVQMINNVTYDVIELQTAVDEIKRQHHVMRNDGNKTKIEERKGGRVDQQVSRLAWKSRPSIKGLKPCVTVDLHGNLARVSKG